MQLVNLWQLIAHDEQHCSAQLRRLQQVNRTRRAPEELSRLSKREGELINELNKLRRLRFATAENAVVAVVAGGAG